MTSTVKLLWLHGDDVHMLDDIIAHEGWTPLDANAVALTAIDDNGVAGFHVLHLVPIPTLWVRPDLRGTSLAVDLATDMEKFLTDTNSKGFIVIADSPVSAKMCEKFGMRLVTSPVYIR